MRARIYTGLFSRGKLIDGEQNQLDDTLETLETVIQSVMSHPSTSPPGEPTRKLLALPARLGDQGFINPET